MAELTMAGTALVLSFVHIIDKLPYIHIPIILQADGMDVLAVKQVTAFAKEYAIKNGPIILELDTYR